MHLYVIAGAVAMKLRTTSILRFTTFVALAAAVASGQQPEQAGGTGGGWRRIGDAAPHPDSGSYAQSQATYGSQYPATPPAELTIRPGTYLTVRIDQTLSSDRSHAGDGFTATLIKPVVVDGIVVAQAGQTLGGRVTEAQKAGRVSGVSRLGVELIDMSLADGQQVPIKTSFLTHVGPTTVGRDVSAVGTTTAVGAAAGAVADGGVGAGIGAAAGAAAGIIGVLVTRGHATELYPEAVLTFRFEAPVTFSTARAPQAFRYVEPQEYQRADLVQRRYEVRQAPPPPPFYGPMWGGPIWGGYPYPYYGPGYWGPSVSFFYGRGFYGRAGYYRGYRR